jgi:hypothetical protein
MICSIRVIDSRRMWADFAVANAVAHYRPANEGVAAGKCFSCLARFEGVCGLPRFENWRASGRVKSGVVHNGA